MGRKSRARWGAVGKAETGGRSLKKVEREFVAHDFQQGLVLQPLVPKAYTAHKSYSRP